MRTQQNQEVEVKIAVADLRALRTTLRRLGARKLGRVHEQNILYDRRRALARRGKLLRLRLERSTMRLRVGSRSKGWLTFKGPGASPSGRYKVREELEIEVSEPGMLAGILAGIGLSPSFRYEKYRSTYALPGLAGVELVLDETPIGVFIELEGARRQIDRAARMLGYTHADYITASYWQLNRDCCRAHGRPVGDMVFKET